MKSPGYTGYENSRQMGDRRMKHKQKGTSVKQLKKTSDLGLPDSQK